MSDITGSIARAVQVENRGPLINTVIWIVTTSSTIFLFLRLYCKLSRRNGLWWDDRLLIASWVRLDIVLRLGISLACGYWICLISSNIVTSITVSLGFGKPSSSLDPSNLPTLGILRLVSETLSIIGVIWSKTSFGITLLRLIEGKTKRLVLFLLITSNLFFAASAIFGWAQCNPIDKNWFPTKPGSCLNPIIRVRFNIFGGVYSGIMDIVLALLPWTVLRGLTMKKREKLAVGIAMSMGVFAGVAAFVKSSTIVTSGSKDFNLDGYPIILWSTTEIGITIIAASIPTLRVLFRDAVVTRSRGGYYQFSQQDTGTKHVSRATRGASFHAPAPTKMQTWSSETEADTKSVELGRVRRNTNPSTTESKPTAPPRASQPQGRANLAGAGPKDEMTYVEGLVHPEEIDPVPFF